MKSRVIKKLQHFIDDPIVDEEREDYYLYRSDLGPILAIASLMHDRIKKRQELFSGWESFSLPKKGRTYIVYCRTNYDDCSSVIRRLSEIRKYEVRCRKLKAQGYHIKSHYKTLWDIQEGRCYFSNAPLGKSFDEAQFHVDHLVPLSGPPGLSGMACGSNWPTNLALVAGYVNLSKGTMNPSRYMDFVRKNKLFEVRPIGERRKIDRRRHAVFKNFMRSNEEGPDVVANRMSGSKRSSKKIP